MWVMGLWIGNARPWARGRQRFRVGPSLARASTMTRLSAGRLWLFSALAVALARTRATSRAARLRHEPQDRGGVLGAAATDGPHDEVGLAGGPAEVLGGGGNAHDPAPYLSDAERSVFFSCPRNVRVGANSPKRWPTMFSVTKTGTCFRPL